MNRGNRQYPKVVKYGLPLTIIALSIFSTSKLVGLDALSIPSNQNNVATYATTQIKGIDEAYSREEGMKYLIVDLTTNLPAPSDFEVYVDTSSGNNPV
jgi:hypothetical protein